MPRRPRFKTAFVRELLRQFTYTPAETKRRLVAAAEDLTDRIEPDRGYPADFVTYRITGFRTDRAEAPEVIPGEALLEDLVKFVQEMSHDLDLPPVRDDHPAIPLDELARRLAVSTKSLQRYRRAGLVCHFVKFENEDGVRLACYEDALGRFRARRPGLIERAAGFSRVSEDDADRLLDRARELREREGLSLTPAAHRLADESGRAPETVRSILRRHDRRAVEPIFDTPEMTDRRRRRLAWRATRFGVNPDLIARAAGVSRTTVVRAANRERRDRLKDVVPACIELATFRRPDAGEVILAHPAARRGLDPGPWTVHALPLLAAVKASEAPSAEEETGLLAAMNFLAWRAGNVAENTGYTPREADLDRVETDLRWLAAVRWRLTLMGLRPAIRTIEQNLDRPLTEQSTSAIRTHLELAVQRVLDAATSLDPQRGTRLEKAVTFQIARAMATRGRPATGRAAAKHESGTTDVSHAFRAVAPWRRTVGPRPDLRAWLDRLEPEDRPLLERRYGWGGDPPQTCVELAASESTSPAAIARRLNEIEARLRSFARGEPDARGD